MEHRIINFFLYQKENVVTITKEKVASRFLSQIYDVENLEKPQVFLDGKCNNYEDNNVEWYDTFNTLVNNKLVNNDVYLLYRNPIKRYYSGSVQHILSNYRYDTVFFRYELNKLFDKHQIDAYELLYHLNTSNFADLFANKKHVEYFKEVFRDYIEWQIKIKPINNVHTEPYIHALNAVSNKLTHHNIFFINIDNEHNDLELIYSKYDTLFNNLNNTNKLYFATERLTTSNFRFYKLLDDVFNENERYMEFRNNFLSYDNAGYKILESHKRNILNLNKTNI
jgi:hypothetical protein